MLFGLTIKLFLLNILIIMDINNNLIIIHNISDEITNDYQNINQEVFF